MPISNVKITGNLKITNLTLSAITAESSTITLVGGAISASTVDNVKTA
jgi:hypothetical protein